MNSFYHLSAGVKQYCRENVSASMTSQMEWEGPAGVETGWNDWQSFP